MGHLPLIPAFPHQADLHTQITRRDQLAFQVMFQAGFLKDHADLIVVEFLGIFGDQVQDRSQQAG
jgi:hypothetical protein